MTKSKKSNPVVIDFSKDPIEYLSKEDAEYIRNIKDKYRIEEVTIPAAILFNPNFPLFHKLVHGLLRAKAKRIQQNDVDFYDEEIEEMLHVFKENKENKADEQEHICEDCKCGENDNEGTVH